MILKQKLSKRVYVCGSLCAAVIVVSGLAAQLNYTNTSNTVRAKASQASEPKESSDVSSAAGGATHTNSAPPSKISVPPAASAPSAGVSPSPSSTPTGSTPVAPPFPPQGLYVDPTSDTARDVASYTALHGADAGMSRLAAQPIARWFGDWNQSVQADANAYVSAALNANMIPMLVAYNIPNRDCGGQSAGGASTASAYAAWINSLAAGIGKRTAIVILEPDATAASCYTSARGAMLASAVATLTANTSASIYLDAGNSAWVSTTTMSNRLQQSGIAQATGFSLNVSNFQTTNASQSYGDRLSALVGNKRYVIDTSRNGNGPTGDNQWCNPTGRALGATPTRSTGHTLADAYLWIKGPGGSDGQCGPQQNGTSAPAAGVWWPEYAVMLLRNAGW